jgi:hypothetical protein
VLGTEAGLRTGGHRPPRRGTRSRPTAVEPASQATTRHLRGTTLSSNQGRLSSPLQAAWTEGRPRRGRADEINRAKRTTRRSHSTPRGGHALEGASEPRHQWVALKATCRRQGIATKQARLHTQRADLHVCAPGRTRTCTLRIRSRPTAVYAVLQGVVLTGQVGSAIQLIRLCHIV